ncbi:Transcription-repair coupling factor [Clostridiaceae bacterium JG1575]|nr:Transcription-repair coupling factor [Clostridiaceae bacterium JG1575]
MRLEELRRIVAKEQAFGDLLKGLSAQKVPVSAYGVAPSARALLLSTLSWKTNRPLFVFCSSALEARSIYEDLLLFEEEAFFFPSRDLVFYDADAVSGDLRWERLKVLREMTLPGRRIIVASIENLLSRWMPLKLYKTYQFSLAVGQQVHLEDLARRLIEAGYERSEVTEGPGQFSLRGGILDAFSPVAKDPIRIELFADEIETIRTFDPESQRSLERIQECTLFPSKEIIIDKASLLKGRDRMESELEDLVRDKKTRKLLGEEAFEKIKSIVAKNLTSLHETWSFETIDSYLPYFYDEPESMLDYLGQGIVVLDDSVRTMGKLESAALEFNEQYETFLARGEILAGQKDLLIPPADLLHRLRGLTTINMSDLLKTDFYLPPKSLAHFESHAVPHAHGQLTLLTEDLLHRQKNGYRTVVLSGTRQRGERLEKALREEGLEVAYQEEIKDLPPGRILITKGSQKSGVEFRDSRLAIISDSEVFGEGSQNKKPRRSFKGKGIEKIRSFDELKYGQYVVHVNHGIGIYRGMKQMESQGALKDYLEISYDQNDRLFIPVDQLDLIQKYIGNEGAAPKVSRLGTQEWTKAKARVRQNVDQVAQEIVALYAQRSQMKGYEFSPDTPWQRAFEEEFPHEETPDQLSSVAEIKKDMQAPRAMDRLLCGDVGFGKTEVAMRAAFKAVMDGKQVAVLVPTTILAEQHYKNFRRRFDGFAVNVDMISRFRTAKQVKESLQRLKEDNLDILVGTHKLLGSGVKFKDLGLLIVDEEQRFGVRHKERLKELKNNVDVLTLSATPIPRTLNMSMTGIRDISLIETPPEDRFPIQTYVVEYNEQLIRDAILREKARSGQCYYVYNRVKEIDAMAARLQQLVPEVTFGVAHGQLSERELESVMVDFMEGRFDVLVSSTIVETGLDISNVNTILIHDADKLGLSQLYQLRGRVGRTNRIAYAYLTYRRDKVLTEVAEKRLRALKDFTELGSGFRIALRDLEIRGAGNMMGKAQHGHMAAVGYDLYIRMLDEAVKKLTGKATLDAPDTVVDIRIDAYIPRDYIADEVLKIQVYKKIAAIETKEDYFSVKEELEDRFSDIPDPTYHLMDVALLRAKAKALGVSEIRDRGTAAVIAFDSQRSMPQCFVETVIQDFARSVQIGTDSDRPQFLYHHSGDRERLIRDLNRFMDALTASQEKNSSDKDA